MKKPRPKIFKYKTQGNAIYLEESLGFLRFVKFYFYKYTKIPSVLTTGSHKPFKETKNIKEVKLNSRDHHKILRLMLSKDEENFKLAIGIINSRKNEK